MSEILDTEDKREIAAIEDRIAEAFANSDATALASQYTEDAILMGPFRPPTVGRGTIEAHYGAVFQQMRSTLKTEVEEVEVAGDWGFMRGTFHQTILDGGGNPVATMSGKYLLVVKKEDGRWKFHRDWFCPVDPPPQPTPWGLIKMGLAGLFGKGGA